MGEDTKKEHKKEQKAEEPEPEEREIAEESTEADEPKAVRKGHKQRLADHWQWLLTHKKISIPAAVALLLVVGAVIPHTRYAALGLFLKQSFPVVVLDAETNKPVTNATVKLDGKQAETDNAGKASIKANVGFAKLEISKKYYTSLSREVVVPVGKPEPLKLSLKAQGRPVPVAVVNKISKQSVANATVTAEGTEVKTDKDGKAIVVVPADKKEVKAKVSGDGFNAAEATLTITTEEVEANTFELTPSGKIYFLSNASGKIDLIKSNLDGSERQTVLAGTGKEDRYNTVLLASRDWKYIALLSKRDGGEYAKLFLIETETDKPTTMDEGEAYFNLYGWSGDRFIYKVNRQKKNWEPKQQALKSYHAPTKKITTLAETAADGDQTNYAYEYFGDQYIYILGDEIAYIKTWSGGGCGYYFCSVPKTQGKQATLNTVRADGSQKKTVKSYDQQYVQARVAEFGEIYILFAQDKKNKVDEYHTGKIETINQNEEDFYNEVYPYYSVSPTGDKTLWSKFIDGKNAFFVGDKNGESGKDIGRSDEYTVYGWFTDSYLLLTKKDSEMYILPASGLDGGLEKSSKISDYYKPNYTNRGFGYGYGG